MNGIWKPTIFPTTGWFLSRVKDTVYRSVQEPRRIVIHFEDSLKFFSLLLPHVIGNDSTNPFCQGYDQSSLDRYWAVGVEVEYFSGKGIHSEYPAGS